MKLHSCRSDRLDAMEQVKGWSPYRPLQTYSFESSSLAGTETHPTDFRIR
jgi:hypothetical protein